MSQILAATPGQLPCLVAASDIARLGPLMAKPRSPEWPKVRDEWLKEHSVCEACGGRAYLEVHHKRPFHLHPELELDPKNLITLCEETSRECHYHFGHNSLSWSCYNPHVEDDAALFLKRRAEAKYE